MREISYFKSIKFDFNGTITKRALVLGDADNDQRNELVCANLQGDMAVFKDVQSKPFAKASDLGMVTSCVIGDVINVGRNYIAAINTEGWLSVFDLNSDQASSQNRNCYSGSQAEPPRSKCNADWIKLSPIYRQLMPANCKDLLLADLDGDGQNEVIVGLTDRVLRTYKWHKIGPGRGKFVGLHKWEFADQIGSVSLIPGKHDNCKDIIVAQPGGTYAKLECYGKKASPRVSDVTQLALEDNPLCDNPTPELAIEAGTKEVTFASTNDPESHHGRQNVDSEKPDHISKLTPEYHQLALSQMRNHHISTEVLGGIRDCNSMDATPLIVIATLDGTLMLVNKDEIIWSLQVDHQLFALDMLHYKPETMASSSMRQSDSKDTIVSDHSHTPLARRSPAEETDQKKAERSQYFVACAWNGKTYIIDEQRNYLRFKFDQPVSAFAAGNYDFGGQEHASLVYATFNNQIVLHYDVITEPIRPMYLLDEIIHNEVEHGSLKADLFKLAERIGISMNEDDDEQQTVLMRRLLRDLLYTVPDRELEGSQLQH